MSAELRESESTQDIEAPDLSKGARKLERAISKVIIRKGRLKTDRTIWEIHVNGEVIEIDAEKLESYGYFRTRYLKVFDMPAPKMKNGDWEDLVQALALKAEKEQAEEESDLEYIAKEIFYKICEMPVIPEERPASEGKALYPDGDCLIITGQKVREICEAMSFKFVPQGISGAFTELGYKNAGSSTVWLNKQKKRIWKLKKEAVEFVKGGN